MSRDKGVEVALAYTGLERREDGNLLIEAYDGDKRIVVHASREAVDDHGLSLVKAVANGKYQASRRQQVEKIWVFEADCHRTRTTGECIN